MTKQEVLEIKMMNFIEASGNAKKALKEVIKEKEKPDEQRTMNGYEIEAKIWESIAYSLIAITELMRKK